MIWSRVFVLAILLRNFLTILGINIFLAGFIPTENLRFRDVSLTFKVTDNVDREDVKRHRRFEYPNMTKTMGGFKLEIVKGAFTDSEIIVLLGMLKEEKKVSQIVGNKFLLLSHIIF